MAIKRIKSNYLLRLIRWAGRAVFYKGWRRTLYNFKHLRGEPEQIAWGGAIGVFIALTPTFGFQCVIAYLVATLFKVNRIIAVALVWITNIFTVIPIYIFVGYVGKLALGRTGKEDSIVQAIGRVAWNDPASIGDFFWQYFLVLWVGALVVGIIAGGITYIVLLNTTRYYRSLRGKKLQKRGETESDRKNTGTE